MPGILTYEQFRSRLDGYLRKNGFGDQPCVALGDGAVQQLFEIVSELRDSLAAVARTRSASWKRDWRDRAKLTRFMRRELEKVTSHLKEYRNANEPLTNAFAIALLKALERVDAQVEMATVRERSQKSLLRYSRQHHQGYVWALNDYLEFAFPEMPKNHVDLLIAGCGVAADLFSKSELAQDVLGRIPKQRSRAKHAYEEVPQPIAPWRFRKRKLAN